MGELKFIKGYGSIAVGAAEIATGGGRGGHVQKTSNFQLRSGKMAGAGTKGGRPTRSIVGGGRDIGGDLRNAGETIALDFSKARGKKGANRNLQRGDGVRRGYQKA